MGRDGGSEEPMVFWQGVEPWWGGLFFFFFFLFWLESLSSKGNLISPHHGTPLGAKSASDPVSFAQHPQGPHRKGKMHRVWDPRQIQWNWNEIEINLNSCKVIWPHFLHVVHLLLLLLLAAPPASISPYSLHHPLSYYPSFTTSLHLLCGLFLFFLPGSSIFIILCWWILLLPTCLRYPSLTSAQPEQSLWCSNF